MGKKKTQDQPRILVIGGCRWPLENAGGNVTQLGYGDDRAQGAIREGRFDGLLLTGGGDVEPLLYTDKRHPRVYGVSANRDDAEWNAITVADEVDIPIMGICRGSQIINVAFGGTLHQHIPDVPGTHGFHNGGDHRVRAAAGSRLQQAWGDDTRWVISIHHQAVDQVADGFVATGWGLDGTIEAIESVDGWILGVQFHPEMAHNEPWHQRIFDKFVGAAAKHAGIAGFRTRTHPDSQRHEIKMPTTTTSKLIVPTSVSPWEKERARTKSTGGSPVLTKWRCFRCTIDFDDRTDHVDHMLFIHGVDLAAVTGGAQ